MKLCSLPREVKGLASETRSCAAAFHLGRQNYERKSKKQDAIFCMETAISGFTDGVLGFHSLFSKFSNSDGSSVLIVD